MVEPLKVRILDHEYLIKSEESEEQVRRIAAYVNNKLLEAMKNTGGLSERKTTILAALDIASDYFQLQKERDDLVARVRERTKALIRRIDSVVG
ncbi:MAG: cell division protein ZapA [Deltaproteobacteria bacterium]|nr:cell division protein ZapA [Deltaproteobacteria bacterium]